VEQAHQENEATRSKAKNKKSFKLSLHHCVWARNIGYKNIRWKIIFTARFEST
jgi:hypothetical protein